MSLTGKIKGSVLQGSINRLYELQGYSAYDVAVLNGFEGTEEEWLSSLKGEKGDPGSAVYKGDPGYTPVKGVDYYTNDDKKEIADEVEESVLASLARVTLDDYIIEHGVTGIWNWCKKASGTAEIWGTVDPKEITEQWIDLPIVVWAAPLNLPVPTVTYSVGGVSLGLFSQQFDPAVFEWESEDDEDGNLIRVTKTKWQTPRIIIYSEPDEDGNIVPIDLPYTVDVHMVGRWKPMDDDKSIQEVLAIKGEDGVDGTSATHSWNGTILTITSASGVSSADLKGEKGDRGEQGLQGIPGEKGETGAKGEKGEKGDPGKDGQNGIDGQDGKPGADGYTPVKGMDYWTEADKAEMVADVISALPKYNGEVIPL